MDDDYEEIEPKKRINTRTLGLIITAIAIIAIMAFYSAQSREEDRSLSLHFNAHDYSLVKGRLLVNITNDGVEKLNIEKVQINQGTISCWRLPKNIEPGNSAPLTCTTTGTENRESYLIIINGEGVDTKSTYKTSITVTAIE